MTQLISRLDIQGFRALKSMAVDSLGSVNLITGKNNAGKSSLLEAIRILASGGNAKTVFEILSYREEISSVGRDGERNSLPSDLTPYSNLFSGFPILGEGDHSFSISAEGSLPQPLSRIKAKIAWFVRRNDPDRQNFSYVPASSDLFGEVEGFPALSFDVAGRQRLVPADRRRFIPYEIDSAQLPCVYLDPFSSRSSSQMGALWDAIALTDAETEVVKALKIVSPDIQAVSLVGSDERGSRSRTAIARSALHASPVPLRTFGDGVNRLFGVILSLCNARNGILLVDEIENGLHYSVQTEIWRTIFRLSSSLKVQVFATSHSWDCVRAFSLAANESPHHGVLVRLSRMDDGRVVPTLFSESELAVVSREQIEVR